MAMLIVISKQFKRTSNKHNSAIYSYDLNVLKLRVFLRIYFVYDFRVL